MSTSAGAIRTIHARLSPTHSPFQSPPDGPSLSASGSSVSSFPSDASFFFFSSAAASPPHEPVPHPVEETLIIPSLTLPALIRPKQLQGPLTRLLVLGPPDLATAVLFVDNPDALDPNVWVYEDGFRVLCTSKDNDNHSNSNERWNIELIALGEDVHQLDIAAIEDRILAPFRSVAALLAPPLLSSAHEEELLTSLLMGHEVPLYTALLVVAPSRSTSTHPSSSSASSLASNSVTLDSALPSIAPPNSSSVSNSAPDPPALTTEVDIPEILRRLVPVIVLVPDPEPTPSAAHHRRDRSRSRSRSRSPTNADTDMDMYTDMDMDLGADAAAAPNDTAATLALPASASGLGLDAPPTARLPTRPRHAARERTATYPRTTTAADVTSTATALTSPHTRTPSALRRALRPPALRVLRAAAAARFVRWWRAGGVDPYAADSRPARHHHRHVHRALHDASAPGSPLRLAVPLQRAEKAPLPLVVRLTEKAQAPVPPAPSFARVHVQPYAHADPLHLPSLLALVRDVVRAWAGAGAGVGGEGDGGGGGKVTVKGWRRGWAFVAGVLLGVGVGVWAAS
ncbi:hypothetical protein DFH08DRAFT_1079046 [Mycena albidolilacea]|uniref:Uncharacterized protein n=1 Tax=Mycena albidolilacea TaxID=1033008 RepID=A0AAD7A5T5_9AGAR|nr:hypothetical protein DFH08DRAFT_1079046 [Mycena albidolilacea]